MQDSLDRKNIIAMKLLHYFITEKNYNPIILQGAEDEIWLENLSSDYKIVRIVSNHILNEEQLDFDLFKTKHVVKKIKKKTLSFNMKVLSIFTDIDDDVKFDNVKNIDCISLYNEEDLKKYDFVNEKFPDLCSKMEFTEEGFQLFMKITADINKKNKEDSVKVDEIFKPKKPIITYILIGINAIIFLLSIFGYSDLLINDYSVWGPGVVIHKEFYRLITGAFIHTEALHFIFNMYSLFVIGSQIESYMGKIKYLIIYFGSILVASLASIIFNGTTASIGASGGIFGLLGALIYFGYHYRVYLGGVIKTQIIPITLLGLLIGFLPGSGIDNFAHIGGLIGGILSSTAVGVKYKSSTFEKVNGTIVTILLIIFLLFVVFNYVNFS